MHRITLTAILLTMGSSLAAQSPYTSASPIPDNAEARFCYYDGLAYSRNSYILVSGGNSRFQAAETGGALNTGGEARSQSQEKLLRCTVSEDGTLVWSSEAAIQIIQK